jgi:hypothetical protein
MSFANPKEKVLIHGLKFDGSGEYETRKVARYDVPAYKQAGWAEGPIPEDVSLKQRIAELEAALAAKDDKKKK